jgi:hypothetical protein
LAQLPVAILKNWTKPRAGKPSTQIRIGHLKGWQPALDPAHSMPRKRGNTMITTTYRAGRAQDSITKELLLEAERQAQRLSSFARAAIVIAFAIAFLLLVNRKAPVALTWVVLTGLLIYLALTFVTLALTRSRWFAGWLAIPLTVIDAVIYGLMVLATLRALDLPPSQFGAVPPFLLMFMLLALAGMRYSPAVVATAVITAAVFALAVTAAASAGLLAGWAESDGVSGLPLLFSDGPNLMRFGTVVATGLLIAPGKR